MPIKITQRQLNNLRKLAKKSDELSLEISDTKKRLIENNGHKEIRLKREGKNIKIMEKVLWEEMFYAGINSQAGEILFKKYPELEKLVKQNDKVKKDLNSFTFNQWGFFFNEMNLSRLIEIILGLIRYKLNPINWFKN